MYKQGDIGMKKKSRIILLIIVLALICFMSVKFLQNKKKHVIFETSKNVFVMPDEVIDGNITAVKGDIYINGIVNGSVRSIKGNIYINGKVMGDVVSASGNVNKGENGEIYGKILEKKQILTYPLKFDDGFGNSLKKFKFGEFIVLIIMCLIIYEISPFVINSLSDGIQQFGMKSIITGYLVMIVAIIITFLLVISILGIFILPLLFVMLAIQFITGFTALMMFLGKNLIKIFNTQISSRWNVVFGIFIYELIRLIPYGGKYIFLFLILPISIGTGQYTIFGIYRPKRRNLV